MLNQVVIRGNYKKIWIELLCVFIETFIKEP